MLDTERKLSICRYDSNKTSQKQNQYNHFWAQPEWTNDTIVYTVPKFDTP